MPENTNSNKNAKQRIVWIDVARGLVIIPIVIFHTKYDVFGMDALHAVRVPFFFFISGFLMRPKPIASVFKRRFRGIMVPYFSVYALLLAMTLLAYGAHLYRGTLTPELAEMYTTTFSNYLQGRLWGSLGVALWFLPSLFWTSLLTVWLMGTRSFQMRLLILGLFLSLKLAPISFSFINYHSLSTVPNALFFFGLGFVFGNEKLSISNYYALLLPFGLGLVFLSGAGVHDTDSISKLCVLPVTLGSFPLLVWICKGLSAFKLTRTALCFIGGRTLAILCFHGFVIYFMPRINVYIDTLFAIGISLVLHQLLSYSRVLAFLFLGQPFQKESPERISAST